MFEKYLIGLRLREDAFRARKPIDGTVLLLGGVGARPWVIDVAPAALSSLPFLPHTPGIRSYFRAWNGVDQPYDRGARVRRDCVARPLNSPTWKSHSSVKRTELVHVAADHRRVIHRVPAYQHRHRSCVSLPTSALTTPLFLSLSLSLFFVFFLVLCV